MRLREADGRPVVSRASAERIGALRHVVLDEGARRITALHVKGRGRKASFVAWGDVVGFGPDAIVVTDEAALQPPSDDRELEVARGHLGLDGHLVLDDRGDSPGVIADVVFDEGSGAVASVACGDAEIPAQRLRSLGPHCLVVLAAAPGVA